MIVDLPSSTTSAVNKKLVELRESGGVLALGRVLTLVIITDDGGGIEDAIEAGQRRQPRAPVPGDRAGPRPAPGRRRGWTRRSGSAATPGPARSIVLRGYGALAADEAGAGMVMPLLLPDAPVVAWWPGEAPAVPSEDPVGKLAAAPDHRRAVGEEPGRRRSSSAAANHVAGRHRPDVDPAHPVAGAARHRAGRCRRTSRSPRRRWPARPSRRRRTCWPAGWPAGSDVQGQALARRRRAPGMVSVRLERRSGPVELRPPGRARSGTLRQPGQPDRLVALARREVRDCLAEELRRLDPDEIYGAALAGVGQSRAAGRRRPRSSPAKPSAGRRRPTSPEAGEARMTPAHREASR